MSSVIAGKVRFTVIDPMCVRMEYSPDGKYRDLPTLFAENRTLHSEEFQSWTEDDLFHLKTAHLEIKYYAEEMRPASGTLMVEYPGGTWTYGKRNDGDLGGVLQSLDGCDKPMPLPQGFLSREGWQVIDDTHASVLRDGWIAADVREETYFDLYFFSYDHNYKAALNLLMTLSGKVPMLPRWCMGSWYSRWFQYTSEDYRNIVKEYEAHGIPLDVMVLDMEWHTRGGNRGYGWGGTIGWTGWSWNRELLPDAEALLEELHDAGLQVTMNVHPHDGIRSHETCYPDFMRAMGASTADGNALPFDAADRKYMENYFRYAHEPLEQAGCNLWWVDWQQDCIIPHLIGFPAQKHVPWLNTCYFNHMKRNHRRGIAFSRWGGWGDQKHPIHFSGDTTSTWQVLAFQIAFTALSGNSGCFFWTHDMGGFCGARQPELYARWLQFGALTAAMRLHSAGDDVDRRPWKWEEPFYTSLKQSFQLRSRLMPYLYTAMHNACRDSWPMLRALYLEYPDAPEAYRNMQEFFCGEALLAAPVTAPGEGEEYLAFQKIWIPEGEYCHFYSGVRYAKGTYAVPATLNEIPLLVRAGFPLVLGKADKKHLAAPDTEFEIQLFPASQAETHSFTLYEDDGVSGGYERGEFAETEVTAASSPTAAKITVAPSNGTFAGLTQERRFAIRIRNVRSVQAVFCNGKSAAFCLENHDLTVAAIPLSRNEELTVELQFKLESNAEIAARAAAQYAAQAPGAETEVLLAGGGAIHTLEPLTGEEQLLVFPHDLAQVRIAGMAAEVTACGETPITFSAHQAPVEVICRNGASFALETASYKD